MFLNVFHNFCTEDKITFVGFFQCLLFSRIRHEEPDRLQTASSSISHHICSVRLNVKVLFRFLFIEMVVVHLLHIFVCLCVFICLYLITGFSSSRCQNKARQNLLNCSRTLPFVTFHGKSFTVVQDLEFISGHIRLFISDISNVKVKNIWFKHAKTYQL